MVQLDEENEVIKAIIAGDREQFALLVERYQRYVFAIVAKRVPSEAVETVAHDAFVVAYRSLKGFRFEGPFRAWLARIANRRCADFWRSRSREREIPESKLTEAQRNWVSQAASSDADVLVEELANQQECRELLNAALTQIPEKDRVLLEMVHLEERPVKEVAEILGVSVSLVKVRAFRIRNKLRKILERWLAEGSV